MNLSPVTNIMNELARDHVGDGLTPNMFFVTDSEGNTVFISDNADVAYTLWQAMGGLSVLEDRLNGTIADEIRDDFERFI